MTWSPTNPLPTVQVLLDDVNNGGTWPYDISAYVRLTGGMQITHGRSDELQQVNPGQASLTLENTDGRFTLGSTTGGYGAINIGRGLRVVINSRFRFQGFVQSWPTAWPNSGGDNFALSQITATDSLARLNQITLHSALEQEYRAAGATQIYMFDVDLSDSMSTTGYTALAHRPELLTWGTDLGLFDVQGINNASYDSFTNATTVVQTDNSIPSNTTGSAAAACVWINGGTWAPILGGAWIDQVNLLSVNTGTSIFTLFTTGADGALWYRVDSVSHQIGFNVLDGRPHLVGVSNSGTALSIFLDGNLIATGTTATAFSSTASMVTGYVRRNYQVATQPPAIYAGFALFPSLTATQALRMYQAGITGSAVGDNSAPAMIGRIAAYTGATMFSDAWDSKATQSLLWPSIKGQNAASVMAAVADSEAGTLIPSLGYAGGASAVAWRSRNYRTQQGSPAATIGADMLDPGQSVAADTQSFFNSVTASGTGTAGSYSRTAAGATSIGKVGTYPSSLTSLQAIGDDARLAAQNRLDTHLIPGPRIGSMSVDLLTNPSIWTAMQTLDVSDWIQVTGLPSQAVNGTTTMDLIVEGWTETLSTSEWSMAINASPRSASVTGVHGWLLDDATYSVLDTSTYLIY